VNKFVQSTLAAAILSVAMSSAAWATEIAGVKLEDKAQVAGKDLVLSGAGLRTKAVFKVYVLGIYLNKKETTPAGVYSATGPKRAQLTMLRDLSGEDFGNAFLSGINKNLDKDEKSKLVNQLVKLGEVFERVGSLKKGDVVHADWVPGSGTIITVNGKAVIEPLPDALFYTAILRIWYGDKPAEVALRAALLGEAG
jgi:Chalcone isomerase-like